MTAVSTETNSMPTVAVAPLEKVPLETYVPPAKPSLIGLSRTEIPDRLGGDSVAPAQRQMGQQPPRHWLAVRAARASDDARRISQNMRAQRAAQLTILP